MKSFFFLWVWLWALPLASSSLVEMHAPEGIELEELAKKMSVLLDKNWIIQEGLKKKIVIIAPKPVPMTVAYALWKAALNCHELAMEETSFGGKIVPLKKTFSLKGTGEDPVTRVWTFPNLNWVRNLAPLWKKALVQTVEPHHLIMTDTAERLKALEDIFKVLEVQEQNSAWEIVELEKLHALEAVERLKFFTGKGLKFQPVGSHRLLLLGQKFKRDEAKNFLKMEIFPTPGSQEEEVKVYRVQWGHSKKILEALKNFKLQVAFHEASQSFLLKGLHEELKKAKNIFENLDKPKPQVRISMIFLEITSQGSMDWSSHILGAAQNHGKKMIVGWQSLPPMASASPQGEQYWSDVLGRDLIITSFDKIKIAGFESLSPMQMLKMLKNDSYVRTLMEPVLLVEDQEDAEIQVGENFLFKNPLGSELEKESQGFHLKVKPKVSKKESLTLQVQLESSKVQKLSQEGLPQMGKKRFLQTIHVHQGQWVFLAGLKNYTSLENEKKVPIISDIPIVGNFFRKKKQEQSANQLFVFLRPEIFYSTQEFPKDDHVELSTFVDS